MGMASVIPVQGAQEAEVARPRLERWSDAPDSHRAAGRALRDARATGVTGDLGKLKQRLVALGSDRARVLFDILARARVPETQRG